MTETSVIEDSAPLQNRHIPSKFVDRESEKEQLEHLISEDRTGNVLIQGGKGTGKTHLTLYRLNQLPDRVNTCYIPGKQCGTQYKSLKRLYQAVTGEDINSGYHTAKLQREIKERTTELQTVVVLDDIEFLLMNDGDSLLYQLSRTNPQKLCLILISSQYSELSPHLEERTLSSLQPRKIKFSQYTAEKIYQVLAERSRDSLQPQTVHREALTYIASQTTNASKALNWLRYAAKTAETAITENLVKQTESSASQEYANQLLNDFTEHHSLTYKAVSEASSGGENIVKTGEIYEKYSELCSSAEKEQLSNRRISDYLKHLELLDLIQSEYHYGGSQGKTRIIEFRGLSNQN